MVALILDKIGTNQQYWYGAMKNVFRLTHDTFPQHYCKSVCQRCQIIFYCTLPCIIHEISRSGQDGYKTGIPARSYKSCLSFDPWYVPTTLLQITLPTLPEHFLSYPVVFDKQRLSFWDKVVTNERCKYGAMRIVFPMIHSHNVTAMVGFIFIWI